MTRTLLLAPVLTLALTSCGGAEQLAAGTSTSSSTPSASPTKQDCYPFKRDDQQEEYRKCRANGGFDNSGETAPWVLRQQAEAEARRSAEATASPSPTEEPVGDAGDTGSEGTGADVIKDLDIGDGVTATSED